jgi:S1-C subfamily serine protease
MAQNLSKYPPKKKRTGWWVAFLAGGLIILCLMGFALVGGFAWLLTTRGGQPEGLTIAVDTPTSEVRVGDLFQITVTLTNEGNQNINISEIQLPNDLLNNVRVTRVEPEAVEGLADGEQTAYDFNLTIAPTGRETIIFNFEAIRPIDASGDISVKAGSRLEDTRVRVLISPRAAEMENMVADDVVEGEDTETPSQDLMMGDVIPYRAVVQIVTIIDLNGRLVEGWTGSGTIISEEGHILTNAHVVTSDRFFDVAELIVAITTAQDRPPERMFLADLVQADRNLDLAVIKVRSDLSGGPANFDALGIEPVRIGEAESLQLGDPIIILGYPGIGGETITLTRGEVSGFTFQQGYGNRAFIKTSATIAGGNSGGLAATLQGEIIGVPTQVGSGDIAGVIVDCRPLADTNRDGVIDERDNCVPTGGFINALRPVNLAQPLLEFALAGQVAADEDPRSEEHQEYEHGGEVVLFDEFVDNRNNWNIGEYSHGRVDILDGQLVINVDKEQTYIFTYMPETYVDLIMMVDVRVMQAAGDGDLGFLCGYVDQQNFTVLEVSEDGYFAIWTLINDQEIYLVDWTFSELIPASGSFTLSAYCGADGFSLAVNDTLLADVDGSYYQPGRVGLFTGTWNQPGIMVGFEAFEILEP